MADSETRAYTAPATHIWRVRTRLPERFGEHCRVLAAGGMNSVLVEFEDGYRVLSSRRYLRRESTFRS